MQNLSHSESLQIDEKIAPSKSGIKHLGGELLKNALLAVVATADVIAFRAVMVHALDDDAERFYLKYGFRQAKGLERTLLLPVKDILASLGG